MPFQKWLKRHKVDFLSSMVFLAVTYIFNTTEASVSSVYSTHSPVPATVARSYLLKESSFQGELKNFIRDPNRELLHIHG